MDKNQRQALLRLVTRDGRLDESLVADARTLIDGASSGSDSDAAARAHELLDMAVDAQPDPEVSKPRRGRPAGTAQPEPPRVANFG